MPLSETVSWLFQVEGNLKADVDKSAAAVEKMGLSADQARKQIRALKEEQAGFKKGSDEYEAIATRIKAVGKESEVTTEKVKAFKAEQKAAAEESAVFTKNLVGMAAVVGTVAVGITMAVAAAQAWISNTIEANKHLREIGETTGENGRSIDRYSSSVDGLTNSFDRLMVSVSGPGFEKLSQLANVLTRISDAANGAGGGVGSLITGAIGMLPGGNILNSGISIASTALTAYGSGEYPGEIPYNGPTFGPSYDDMIRGRSQAFLSAKTSAPAPIDINALRMAMAGAHSTQLPYGVTTPTGGQTLSSGFDGLTGPGFTQTTGTEKMGGSGSGLTATKFAGVLGAAGGGLPSLLSAAGPVGMAVGAVAGLAPHLGKTFDGLIGAASKLPDQLMRGIDHILAALPDVLSTTIPDLVGGIAGMIPDLISALVQSLPAIIKAGTLDLPAAIGAALTPGGGASTRGGWGGLFIDLQHGGDVTTHGPAGDKTSGWLGNGPRGGQARQAQTVHNHFHEGNVRDVMRRIRLSQGSYGLNDSLLPPVT